MATGEGSAGLRVRTVDGVLPSWVDGHLGNVRSGDLAIGADGDAVIALTARKLTRKALVLASVDSRGAVRTRQLSRRAEGLVSMRATPSGRIGVLVEDTGITDDLGECMNDRTPRRLSASVRERGSRRFGTLRLLATPPLSCVHTEGRVLGGTDNRLAIVWGTAPEVPPQLPTIDAAFAEIGKPFGTPASISTGMVLRSATFAADALVVAMAGTTTPYYTGLAPLFAQRFPLGAPGSPQPIGEVMRRVLIDAGASGLVATAWQGRLRELRLTVGAL